MNRSVKNLVCLLAILMLTGTVSGAGYVAAEHAGISVPGDFHPTARFNGNAGMSSLSLPGGSGSSMSSLHCYFPIWNLPSYYVCIMGCKIAGYGDICPTYCELALSVCE